MTYTERAHTSTHTSILRNKNTKTKKVYWPAMQTIPSSAFLLPQTLNVVVVVVVTEHDNNGEVIVSSMPMKPGMKADATVEL